MAITRKWYVVPVFSPVVIVWVVDDAPVFVSEPIGLPHESAVCHCSVYPPALDTVSQSTWTLVPSTLSFNPVGFAITSSSSMVRERFAEVTGASRFPVLPAMVTTLSWAAFVLSLTAVTVMVAGATAPAVVMAKDDAPSVAQSLVVCDTLLMAHVGVNVTVVATKNVPVTVGVIVAVVTLSDPQAAVSDPAVVSQIVVGEMASVTVPRWSSGVRPYFNTG